MSEQFVEERRGWASDIVWVALYSILVLLLMVHGQIFLRSQLRGRHFRATT
jgi:hypothetical protein